MNILSSFTHPYCTDTVLLSLFRKTQIGQNARAALYSKSRWLFTPPNTTGACSLLLTLWNDLRRLRKYYTSHMNYFYDDFFSAFLSFLEPRTDLVWKTVLTFWVGTSWGWVNNGNISGWTFLSRLMLLSYSFIQIDLNRDHRVSTADYTGILFWSASLRGSLAVFGSWPRCFLKDEEMP